MSSSKEKSKYKSDIILDSMEDEDRILVKKVILNDGESLKGIRFTKTDFDTAFLRGDPMVMSIPSKYVEKLKQRYVEYLKKQAEKTTANENEVLKNDE